MKQFRNSILILMAVVCFNTTYAVNSLKSPAKQSLNTENVEGINLEAFQGITLEEFVDLKPSEIREKTGKKLKLKEVVALKAAQKKVKKTLKGKGGDGPKSQIVALVLCVLIGALGIHRFYLGYTTIGIIQLLTLGGCGIWALIDLIMIITGDLVPADGSAYDPTL